MRSLILSAAALALIATPALAQDPGANVYGSVGYSQIDAEGFNLGAITARVGTRFTPNFGVEGELSFGLGDDSGSLGGSPVNAELEYDASVYGVAYLPVSPNFELFGRVGYGKNEIKFSDTTGSLTVDDESWNYGVGAQYSFDGQNGIRGDWTRRDFQDGGDADVWSLNFVRKF
ncbi:porin family protein [Brevundimonas sp.]|uniref:porin family protein n=1 Tax=Brevundimonas sp. TaxID=1871086 RepID=UPI001DE3BA4E|nr:porin family protein [Brevundimonas sp.]MBL0946869.1 porin family protein [Brevundimonas sp.]